MSSVMLSGTSMSRFPLISQIVAKLRGELITQLFYLVQLAKQRHNPGHVVASILKFAFNIIHTRIKDVHAQIANKMAHAGE